MTDKRALWQERIQAFQYSGLSRRAWCLEQNLPEHQLGYWIRKLQPKEEMSNQRWVGIEPSSLSETGVSIQVGDVVLDVKRGFDHQFLADVVRTLITIC